MKMFALKTFVGLVIRLVLLVPLTAELVMELTAWQSPFAEYVGNISTFILVILGLASVLYLVVMTLIPPEYAIKTDIHILEFNMWLPQVIAVNFMGIVTLCLCIAFASIAAYWSALVLFFYALSHFLWPKYAKKIDLASKQHMMEQLQQ